MKRNAERFPEDFIFQLSAAEKSEVITNCDHLARLKFAKSLPFAFTEHGAIVAASVLNSREAVAMSVYIVRVFKHRFVAGAGFEPWSGSHTELEPAPRI